MIVAPLLKKVVPELEKAGTIEVRSIAHNIGISFLGEIEPQMPERIGSAIERVIVMPRQGCEKLDDTIDFGVVGFAKHIEPAKKACAATGNVPHAE